MSRSRTSSKTEERRQKNQQKAKRNRLMVGSFIVFFLLVAGVGWTVVQQRTRQVYDLSVVGQGVPVVVQVHDTTCPICVDLRQSIDQISPSYASNQLLFRIADVSNPEAVSFIAPYTTNRRVTLLFFNGQGDLVNTLVGAQSALSLREAFGSLIR
jgi:hypothetical protein